jgi:hypothetical protein
VLKEELDGLLGIRFARVDGFFRSSESRLEVEVSDALGRERLAYETVVGPNPLITETCVFEAEALGLFFRLSENVPDLGTRECLRYVLVIATPLEEEFVHAGIVAAELQARRISIGLKNRVRMILDSELEYAAYDTGTELYRDTRGRDKLLDELLRR